MTSYKLMLVMIETAMLHEWVKFALRFFPINGELHMRGLVFVDADKSLSEEKQGTRISVAPPALSEEAITKKVIMTIKTIPMDEFCGKRDV